MTYHDPRLARLGGAETRVVPQSVSGRFRRLKWAILALALAVTYGLPMIRWDRGPGRPGQAILFDLEGARVHLFALEIRPQEFYYLTGALVLATLVLILTNALAGRIWCGFFCPQTIWTDLFLLVERRIEGDRRERLRELDAPLTVRRVGEIVLKHAIWLAVAALTGGAGILYFADAPTLVVDLVRGTASPVAYGVLLSLTATTYGLAGFAREKMCTFMCPWPRLQGAIWDAEALTVNYRDHRGEPRMSVKKAAAARAADRPAGDCVDCNACVAVCPMGIDIRLGPSIACINCGLCVDACDGTMGKLGRERGLIDFETWTNVERGRRGEARRPARLVRPKTVALAVAILALSGGMVAALTTRAELTLAVMHDRDPVAVALSDGRIRNGFELRIANATAAPATVEIAVAGAATATIAPGADPRAEAPSLTVRLGVDETRRLRVGVFGRRDLSGDLRFTVTTAGGARTEAVDRFALP